MLVRVSVASDSLSADNLPLPVANSLHRALLDDLHTHGRLVFAEDAEVMALIKAIRSGPGLPPDVRKGWEDILVHLKQTNRLLVLSRPETAPLASIRTIDDMHEQWGACTDLAIVSARACGPLGVPEDSGLLADPVERPDIATTGTAPYSPALARAKDLRSRGVAPHGSSREEFWAQVLQPLASEARTATVLDRYLPQACWDIQTRQRWARAWRNEHITWLLEHLDVAMAPNAEVRLIASRLDREPMVRADEVAAAIRNQWEPAATGRIERVTLTLATPPRPSAFPHDRHIRFSTAGAIEIPAGFDRLREPTIWDADGMKWNYRCHPQPLRDLQAVEVRASSYAHDATASVLER